MLKNIASDDANFEFLTSNNVKNFRLPRRNNIVAASKAIIFVNTNLRGLEYKGAIVRMEHYEEFFKILGFDSIIVFIDLSKDQIIEQMTFLKKEVNAFSNNQDRSHYFRGFILKLHD